MATKRTKAEQKRHEHDIEVRTRVIVALLTNFDAADQRRVIDQVTAQLGTGERADPGPDGS
jgi:hypothetical protein